jgi:two-component system response regulator YesN
MMKRLLVVDDEPLICSGIARRVQEADNGSVVAATASNGREALEWLDDHYADICVTDIRMPVMNGLELIREINNRYSWMASIVISSYEDFGYARESVKLSVKDYILKPIKPDAFRLVLERTSQEADSRKKQLASAIFMERFPEDKHCHLEWIDCLQHGQYHTLPSLVVDTLELLESWAGQRFDLLEPLAHLWLDMMYAKLQFDHTVVRYCPDFPPECQSTIITLPRYRALCRMMAVGVLETTQHALNLEKSATQGRRIADTIKSYIDQHYMENFQLDDLARLVFISRSYLTTVFKQEAGISIWGYVQKVRLHKAREYLLNSSLRIYEIAGKVGYEDRKYFSDLFKSYYGKSPQDYKRAFEHNP